MTDRLDAAIDRPTEDDYFRFDDVCGGLMQALARTSKPGLRALYIGQLGIFEWRRSRMHTAVFGEDPHDKDGSPAAVWLADSARLLWILADTESGRRWIDPLRRVDEREKELRAAAAVPLACWGLGARRRRPLLKQMVDIWVPITPGQAVESIACIPAPRWMR